jgi:hypothetical protein
MDLRRAVYQQRRLGVRKSYAFNSNFPILDTKKHRLPIEQCQIIANENCNFQISIILRVQIYSVIMLNNFLTFWIKTQQRLLLIENHLKQVAVLRIIKLFGSFWLWLPGLLLRLPTLLLAPCATSIFDLNMGYLLNWCKSLFETVKT